MNQEEYKQWKIQISKFMKMQNEHNDFIEFVLDWIDGMKGSEETDLILKYHPDFIGKSKEEAFDFILKARHIPSSFKNKDFQNQNFNSAFFLYRPLLKMLYLDSNYLMRKS